MLKVFYFYSGGLNCLNHVAWQLAATLPSYYQVSRAETDLRNNGTLKSSDRWNKERRDKTQVCTCLSNYCMVS